MKVSIIVPVYNAEKYIMRCADSIIKQTHSDFEVFLVNDGSTDNSLEMCYRIAEADSRFQVLNKENGGAASARNFALSHVEGKYVTFLDSDDCLAKNFLEYMLQATEGGKHDIVQACEKRVDNDFQIPTGPHFNKKKCRQISKVEALNKRKFKVCVWGKLYKSNIVKNIRIPEGHIYEDDAIYYKFIDAAQSLVCVNETLYYYYMTSNSVIRNTKHKKDTAFIKIYKDRIKYFQEKGDAVLLNGSCARFGAVLILFYSGRKKDPLNENDLGEILQLYKENYKSIKFNRKLLMQDRILLLFFKISPNLTAFILNKIRKSNFD